MAPSLWMTSLVARFLEDLDDYQIKIVPLDDHVSVECLALYPEYSLRAPDALHFTTAQLVGKEVERDPLYMVTSDGEIASACEESGLLLLNPNTNSAAVQLNALR